jgi:LmbE family N-acetylglucosaminyl deacetylase
MPVEITYSRRNGQELLVSTNIADVMPDWRGRQERWLFVSPHDDDVVAGGGLAFQVGVAVGAEMYAAIVSDGRMGYCRPEQRESIAAVRMAEARRSFEILGLPAGHLQFLGFADGDLDACRGRRLALPGTPTEVCGGIGLQNSLTYVVRQVRPTRVFLPTSSDLHPDHRVVHEELLISLFHAQGAIWPELGAPIAEVPRVYEFAIYCDFPAPPNIRIETPLAMLETKLAGIAAYASQEQIGTLVEVQRRIGPLEYLRELDFHFYDPSQYDSLFARSR